MSTEWKIPITFNLLRVDCWENASLFFLSFFTRHSVVIVTREREFKSWSYFHLCYWTFITLDRGVIKVRYKFSAVTLNHQVSRQKLVKQAKTDAFKHVSIAGKESTSDEKKFLALTANENSSFLQDCEAKTSHLHIHAGLTFLVKNDRWGKLTTGKQDHNFSELQADQLVTVDSTLASKIPGKGTWWKDFLLFIPISKQITRKILRQMWLAEEGKAVS